MKIFKFISNKILKRCSIHLCNSFRIFGTSLSKKGWGEALTVLKMSYLYNEKEVCSKHGKTMFICVKSEWWTLSLTFLYILLFVKGIIQLYIVRSISNLTLLSKRKNFQCTYNTQECKMYPTVV